MHMYVFVFDQNTSMTKLTLFGGQFGRGRGNIKFLLPLHGKQNVQSSLEGTDVFLYSFPISGAPLGSNK